MATEAVQGKETCISRSPFVQTLRPVFHIGQISSKTVSYSNTPPKIQRDQKHIRWVGERQGLPPEGRPQSSMAPGMHSCRVVTKKRERGCILCSSRKRGKRGVGWTLQRVRSVNWKTVWRMSWEHTTVGGSELPSLEGHKHPLSILQKG